MQGTAWAVNQKLTPTCMSGMQAGRIGADHLAACYHCLMAELHLKQGNPDQADGCLAKAAALGGRHQERSRQIEGLAQICILVSCTVMTVHAELLSAHRTAMELILRYRNY